MILAFIDFFIKIGPQMNELKRKSLNPAVSEFHCCFVRYKRTILS